MSHKSSREQPSPVYVFVVLSLAAFLTLFTFCRQPGITCEVQATFQSNAAEPTATDQSEAKAKLATRLLEPAFVLNAMQNASIIKYKATTEARQRALMIAQRIVDRMQVRSFSRDREHFLQVVLVTERPQAGMELLDSMMRDINAQDSSEVAAYAIHPATISRQRGGSISSANLALMLFVSCLVGIFGLLIARQSRPSSVLSFPEEVDSVAGIPVVANFAETIESSERKPQQSRRRVSQVLLRVAEVAVAAVFLLVVFNLATQDAFLDRFVSDPFAAYGEVLTGFIG